MSHRIPIEQRFWAKVDERGPDECWPWLSTKSADGYGRLREEGRRHRYIYAHRFAYELLVGPIPAGLTIDHLCRHRHCVNPAHMEPVSNAKNVLRGDGLTARQARQTHCKRGHLLSGENLYLHRGMRHCRTCKRERQQQ